MVSGGGGGGGGSVSGGKITVISAVNVVKELVLLFQLNVPFFSFNLLLYCTVLYCIVL